MGSASNLFPLGVRLWGNLCSSAASASLFQWRYLLYFCWSIVYRLYALDDADLGGSVGLGGLLGMDWTVYGVVAPVLWV
jgi:hypothetical protein